MNYYTAVSPFWLITVSVCRRSGLIAVSPFWFVAVLACRRFGNVAVLTIDPRHIYRYSRKSTRHTVTLSRSQLVTVKSVFRENSRKVVFAILRESSRKCLCGKRCRMTWTADDVR